MYPSVTLFTSGYAHAAVLDSDLAANQPADNPGACNGNFDGDGNVDGSDLVVFAADFGETACMGDCEGDFDGDGDVDGISLALISEDYGRTDCSAWIGGTTVYVVDDPPAGSPIHFRELSEAVSYLQDNVPAGELGTLVIQTDRQLDVDELSFSFDLNIEVAGGYQGSIAGPGTTALVVNAAGAIRFSGLTVSNSGGVVFNANRRIDLAGNHLPESVAINIGGVGAAPFPAAARGPGISSGQAPGEDDAGSRAYGALVMNNDFLDLKLNFALDPDQGSFQFNNNRGSSIATGGTGTVSGSTALHFGENGVNSLSMDVKFSGNASATFLNHADLNELLVKSEVNSGRPTFNFAGNITAMANVALGGAAAAGVYFKGEHYNGNATWDFGISELSIAGLDSEFTNLAVTLLSTLQRFDWDDSGTVTIGDLNVTAVDIPDSAHLSFDLKKFTSEGYFQANVNGFIDLKLTEDSSLKAGGYIEAAGNVMNFKSTGLRCGGFLHFYNKNLRFGINAEVKGGTFRDSLFLQNETSVNVSLTVFNSVFGGSEERGNSAGIYVYGPFSGSSSSLMNPDTYPHLTAEDEPRINSAQILISKLNLQSDNDWIEIVGVSSGVTIENSSITARSIAVHLERVSGPIRIRNNSKIYGGGVNIFDSSSSAKVENNTIHCDIPHRRAALVVSGSQTPTITENTIIGASGCSGLDLTDTGTHTVSSNTIIADGYLTEALDVTYDSRVYATSNQISGDVHISGGARLALTGNRFSGTTIEDDYLDPGLLNDPMEDNQGLNPNDIWTKIDWDGNGCCDYPPPWNQKDPEGKCECDGVPPPG